MNPDTIAELRRKRQRVLDTHNALVGREPTIDDLLAKDRAIREYEEAIFTASDALLAAAEQAGSERTRKALALLTQWESDGGYFPSIIARLPMLTTSGVQSLVHIEFDETREHVASGPKRHAALIGDIVDVVNEARDLLLALGKEP